MGLKFSSFARRGPDTVTEELVDVLLDARPYEFKALFGVVHAGLRARNAVSGGEEMLARWLLQPATIETVRQRQEAVTDLRPRLDLREELTVP